MMRAMIDTNVILDYVLGRQPFHADAEKIVLMVAAEDIVGYVSSITPVNVYYTGKKFKGKDHALKEVRRLVRLFEIAAADKQTLQNAFDLGFSDYEDAVQCASAVAEGIDGIVTRDTKDYANSPIPVYSPAQFLNILNTEAKENTEE